jgi:hypothetical protein
MRNSPGIGSPWARAHWRSPAGPRPGRIALVFLWLGLSLNIGLEDPACPHHGTGGHGSHAAGTRTGADHAAHGPGDHGQAAHGPGAVRTTHGAHSAQAPDAGGVPDCQCLGVCVPEALLAVPTEAAWTGPPSAAVVVFPRPTDAEAPLLAPIPHLLPFATAPPVSHLL